MHEFKIQSNQLAKLSKLFLQLSDSCDHWHAIMTTHVKENLRTTSQAGGIACFLKLMHRG